MTVRHPSLDYPDLDSFADTPKAEWPEQMFAIQLQARMIIIELNQMRIELEKIEVQNENLRKANDELAPDARLWRRFISSRVSER